MALAPITYKVEADLLRTGTYAGTLDNISAYVTGMTFSYGMDNPMGQLAPPAQAEIRLANVPDALTGVRPFNADYAGSELLTNGDFSAWTAGVPDGWTIDNASAGVRVVSQVGSNKLYGEGGTGSLNLYWTTGVPLRVRQNAILTQYKTYRARMTIKKISGNGGVFFVNNATRVGHFYHTVGVKELVFQARIGVNFGIQVTSYTGVTANVTIDDVSVVEVADYALLTPGTLIKISSPDAYGIGLGTGAIFWQGRVMALNVAHDFASGSLVGNAATLLCECPTGDLANAEYRPKLLTNTTADVAIAAVLNSGVVQWPYATGWRLGVEGASELGLTTRLPVGASEIAILEPGESALPFVGDASERGEGVSALAFIQDIVAAELGRFFWDARLGVFVLNSRNHDSADTTALLTLTSDQYTLVEENLGSSLANEIEVNYAERVIGAVNSVVWTAGNLPRRLNAYSTQTFTARYEIDGLGVAAQDWVMPVAVVDYSATQNEDGSGANFSNRVSVSVEWDATGAKVGIGNASSEPLFLQTLQLRATPLITRNNAVTVRDGASILKHGLRPAPALELVYVASSIIAERVGAYLLAQFSTLRVTARRVQFVPESATDLANAWFATGIGTRIQIQASETGHDGDYIIVGMQASYDAKQRYTLVEWTLKPAVRTVFWRLGVAGQSELGNTTRLGF